MSPTLLRRLRAVERVVYRWQQASYREALHHGGSSYWARHYSNRGCWPDAATMAARPCNRDLFA